MKQKAAQNAMRKAIGTSIQVLSSFSIDRGGRKELVTIHIITQILERLQNDGTMQMPCSHSGLERLASHRYYANSYSSGMDLPLLLVLPHRCLLCM